MLDLARLADAVQHEGGVSRRLFLAYAASLSAIPLLGQRATASSRRVRFDTDPFRVGVASGDPTDRGVVLWTRLAPEPLEPGGGMDPENVAVTWEVASDEAMRNVVRRGTAVAARDLAHSVHVEVDRLAPDRWYWYRFRAGDAESPVGRTRTMPRPNAMPEEMRFAFASCQHYESGLYTAYQHMAADELDLVFHLGDYIYEGRARSGRVRRHVGPKLTTLDDFRIRHAQYKTDPLLQAMHARCPWAVTWDDHEVENNYADDISQHEGVDPAEFLKLRANAYQAYYEMLPLRHTSLPRGPHMQLYRKLSFGRLAEFLVLDTRQYRTNQPNGDGRHNINDEATTPDGTIMGPKQFGWVQASLVKSPAHWNVLAQQVLMAMVNLNTADEPEFSMDKWSGYVYERRRLVEFLDEVKVSNPVVLSGDIHSNWVNDLRVDDRHPETPVIATEFVGTSISSGGNGGRRTSRMRRLQANNPCVQFYNGERGYVRCTLKPQLWQTDYCVVPDVTEPGAPLITRASFAVESGRPGAQQV